MNTLKHIVASLLLLFSITNIGFAQGDFTYILTLNEYSCPTNRTTIVETHNKYYIVTDVFVPDYKLYSLLTVYDENMHPLKTITLHEPEESILPYYFFSDDTSFYGIGLKALGGILVAKPVFVKYDTNFNPLHPPIVYAFEDSITDYICYGVIQNAENEFICLLQGYYFDSLSKYHPTGRLLRVDKAGNLLEDVLFPFGGTFGTSIAEQGNYYYIDRAEHDFILRCSKDAFGIFDTLYFTPHFDDNIEEGLIISVGDQLLRTATAMVYHDECGNPPPWEADRSITFLDTAMNVLNRITVGNPCINEANWGFNNMDYIHPDSIFYVYASDVGGWGDQNICVTNFRQDGTINYHHTIVTGEISGKSICGCKALSDGGVLIYGQMNDFIAGGICGGYVMKYHPYMNDLPRPYINYYSYTSAIEEPLPVPAEVTVYPNPVQGTLYIMSSEAVEQVRVYDISGRELIQLPYPAQSIDISTLANGIYLVKVKTAQGETVKKIVKQ